MTFAPSPFQQAIFDEIANGSGHVIVEAVAGSGKTTTIKQATRLLKPGGQYVLLAFSAAIAEELKSGIPYFVKASTFHSYCYAALKTHLRLTGAPRPGKVADAFRDLVDDKSVFFKYREFVVKLVSFLKANGSEPDRDVAHALADHFDLTVEDGDFSVGVAYALDTLTASNNNRTCVDFDDMIYLPYLWNLPLPPCDVVFVDEAQDLSPIQHELLSRMLRPNTGRLVAVGDPNQAIYAFRGADATGMDRIRETFSAKTLPLSVSYRCSQAVVAEARRALGETE